MEKIEMIQNFKTNCPQLELPPDTWFELTDEQRERAESAPVSWSRGILPPEEYDRRFRE